MNPSVWIQIPQKTAIQYAELHGIGYSYTNEENVEMIEHHVDDVPSNLMTSFDVQKSVCAPSNTLPIIIIGQDECVFSQYLLSSKMWMGPNNESPLLPKSEGEGHMISAFQSCDFGFGLQISDDKLCLINAKHQNDGYIDTAAAMEVFGSIQKNTC